METRAPDPLSRLLIVTTPTTPDTLAVPESTGTAATQGCRWSPLTNAALEADGIVAAFSDNTRTVACRVSPIASHVLEYLPGYHAIHFACHGFSHSNNPLEQPPCYSRRTSPNNSARHLEYEHSKRPDCVSVRLLHRPKYPPPTCATSPSTSPAASSWLGSAMCWGCYGRRMIWDAVRSRWSSIGGCFNVGRKMAVMVMR